MDKLSLECDSESTGIVENPLTLKSDCEPMAVLCEKLQGHVLNKSDIIDNGKPRCSYKEPNGIENNSMNDDADSELDYKFYDAVQQSFSVDSDRSSDNAFCDATELNSSNAVSDIGQSDNDGGERVGEYPGDIVTSMANDDESTGIVARQSSNDGGEIGGTSPSDIVASTVNDDEPIAFVDLATSDDSDGDWETENSDNDSEYGHDSDGQDDYDSYDDSEMADDYDPDSIENFELSESLREEIHRAKVESTTLTWNYQSRASVTDDASESCSVCLTPFDEKVEVRRLPCLHVFHKVCADKWLFEQQKLFCPSCRMRVDRASDYLN